MGRTEKKQKNKRQRNHCIYSHHPADLLQIAQATALHTGSIYMYAVLYMLAHLFFFAALCFQIGEARSQLSPQSRRLWPS